MPADVGWQSETSDGVPPGCGSALRSAFDSERARLFLWSPVALGSGIAAYFSLGVEPPSLAVASVAAIALFIRAVTARGSMASAIIAALVLATLGFSLAKLRTESVRAPVLTKSLRNVEVTGVVVRAEPRQPGGQRLTISVDAIAGLSRDQLPALVRVGVMKAGTPARPGDRVSIKATLQPPPEPALPVGFDFARTAWFERLGGVGYAFSAPAITPGEKAVHFRARANRFIEDVRQSIGERVRAALPGEVGAIAVALITGERSGISSETNDAFKNSGLFHILSISGLHMVIMAGAVFYSVRLLLALVPAIALRLPIKKIAAVAGIIAALLYLAISGGAFATVRSALMIVIMFVAVLLDRPALALRNVAIAAFVILAIYPESLLDAGFQMSFAAVTALIAAYEAVRLRFQRRSDPHPVLRVAMFFGGIVLSTVIASVAVAPFAAYHFHQSQQYAVVANLIAIPICNFIVMPAALLALLLMPFGLESVALYPMGLGIAAMTWCATWVAAIPGAVGRLPAIPLVAFALMIAGGLWFLLWQSRMRVLGLAVIAAGILIAPTLPRPDMLVAKGGDAVAVRNAQGVLATLPSRSGRFEIERWLQHDGDGRSVKAAQKTGAFKCDAVGCVATVKGRRVAIGRHPAAVSDDCTLANVLVLTTPRPKACDGPDLVIDYFDVWRRGTHALYLADGTDGPGGFRVETVAARRGDRPWSPERIAPLARAKLPKPQVVPLAPGNAAGEPRTKPREPPASDETTDGIGDGVIDDELGLLIPDADDAPP